MIRNTVSSFKILIILDTFLIIAVLGLWICPIPKINSTNAPHSIALAHQNSLGRSISPPDIHQLALRPIFVPTRRSPLQIRVPAIVNTSVIQPAPDTNGILLLGILHDGTTAIALVKVQGFQRLREVGLGDKLGNWTISMISFDRLQLKSGNFISELIIPKPKHEDQPKSGSSPVYQGLNQEPSSYVTAPWLFPKRIQ